VVPGSLEKVMEDADSVLYTVTVLKGMYEAGYYEGEEFVAGTKIDLLEAFSKILREKRYVVRENFTHDPSQQGKSAMKMEQLQVEVDNMRSGLTRWCKTHFGEAFVAWMHIKVIRVFVESVLRYGLPVDFTAVLYKVTSGKEVMLVNALDKTFGETGKDADDVEEEEYHDFVLIKFEP
jgi:V-type H+-transporting ATPase subunit C